VSCGIDVWHQAITPLSVNGGKFPTMYMTSHRRRKRVSFSLPGENYI
jgi:hypothetical protein